ncbi:hypothetical protein FIBSPDRAFT_934181 [Athelia psychrophila]|uniref:DUF6593 domain-containing protein n=1 Tax=Athelia psychrophila TaxID=1759441 RepID=A0A166FVV4_9AGAM|nr:hypothetical protein FIBSPDRAFT_934181 [Fibularhizoctonia sp. CBS 109695]
MDSQVTLVNPSPSVSLVFDSYSIRNAHIALSTDPFHVLYSIHTAQPKPAADSASYIRTGERTLAAIQQNEVLPDKVTFYAHDGAKAKVSVNKWLKKGTLSDNYPVRFMIFDGSSYYWKSDKNFRLALYNSNDHQYPIATYAAAAPVAIVILAEHKMLLAHAPEVLAAFIIQESKMRQGEKFREVAVGMAQMEAVGQSLYSTPSGNVMS